MMSKNRIQVFEHTYLPITDNGLQREHWEALGNYNELHGGKYCKLAPHGVWFNQYVGVVQIGPLTIEILPKVGRYDEKGKKAIWQGVLLDMLQECRWMRVHAHHKASLRFKSNSVLEAYFSLFMDECDALLRHGLIKKYRQVDGNCRALKGKLLFGQHLQKNLIHQEQFYTRHQVYDKDHHFNQILYEALKTIPRLYPSPAVKDRCYQLLLAFPDLSELNVNEQTFAKLNYDRKTVLYRPALEIAAMLLLNFRPDIQNGPNHILAILFDMNELWEEFVFLRIQRCLKPGWFIRAQSQKEFWRQERGLAYKVIKPDMILENPAGQTIVLDTKWKLADQDTPSDNDLKQMFVYNTYWSATHAILLYPQNEYTAKPAYRSGKFIGQQTKCGLLKLSVLDAKHHSLDGLIGDKIVDLLTEGIFIT